MKSARIVIGMLVLLAACGKNPFDRTKDASGGGPTGAITGVGGAFVIFNGELTTGGGAYLYPGSENQSLSFSDRSNPLSERSIRYAWNGGDVSNPSCGGPEHTYAGFDLMDAPTQSQYDANTQGRILTDASYGKATFYARGSLSSNTMLKVEVTSPGNPGNPCVAGASSCMILSTNGTDLDPGSPGCVATAALSGNWQQYSIPIAPARLANVKDFFKATYVFIQPLATTNPGQGGTVYFDRIQYEP